MYIFVYFLLLRSNQAFKNPLYGSLIENDEERILSRSDTARISSVKGFNQKGTFERNAFSRQSINNKILESENFQFNYSFLK